METKFTIGDKAFDWLEEIDRCYTFNDRDNISVTPLLKEILFRNTGAHKQAQIENLKYQIIKFVVSDRENLGLTRASGLYMSKEDSKYFPLYNGCHRSHLFIRGVVWEKFKKEHFVTQK